MDKNPDINSNNKERPIISFKKRETENNIIQKPKKANKNNNLNKKTNDIFTNKLIFYIYILNYSLLLNLFQYANKIIQRNY